MEPKLYFTGYSSGLESKENGFYLSASIVVVTSWGDSVVWRGGISGRGSSMLQPTMFPRPPEEGNLIENYARLSHFII